MNSLDSIEKTGARAGVCFGNCAQSRGLNTPDLADLLRQADQGSADIALPSIHSINKLLKRNTVPHANPSIARPMLASAVQGVDSLAIGVCF